MPKPWEQIESDPGFKALPPERQALVQREWMQQAESELPEERRQTFREFVFTKYPHGNEDPAYGQTTLEAQRESFGRNVQTSLVSTFLTGPGAILEGLGMEDNVLQQEGKAAEKRIEESTPISRTNQEKFSVEAAGAIGQAVSMLLTAPLGGPEVKGASFLYKTRQLAMIGGFQGAAAGEEEATRLQITDPLRKAAMIFGYGTAEAFSEKLGGYGVEQGLSRILRGEIQNGGLLKRVVGGALVEGIEEVGAGVPQRAISKGLATEDAFNPGFTPQGEPIYHPADVGMAMHEFSLGAVAGGAMVSVQGIFGRMTPQQKLDTQNVSAFPDDIRKKAFEALQQVSAEEAQATDAANKVDPSTAAAMRVAFDGKRANVLEAAEADTNKEFKPGWEQREKATLTHTSEEQDAYFDGGQWMVSTGLDEQGQPVMKPAPNAAELEEARQEFIRTGQMPEGMQPLQTPTPPVEAPSVTPAPASVTPAPQPTPPTAKEPGKVTLGAPAPQPIREPGKVTLGAPPAAAAPAPPAEEPAPPAPTVATSPTPEPVSPSPEPTPPSIPAEPEPLTASWRERETLRVKKLYPNSPKFAYAVEMAVTDMTAKAIMDQQEEKAQLVEELATLDETELASRLKSAGADTLDIQRWTTGNKNFRAAADFIHEAQQKKSEASTPAPEPVVTREEVTPPAPPKRRLSRPRAVVGDILDAIEDEGGLISLTRAKQGQGEDEWERNKKDYDDRPSLYNPTHNFIYGNGMGGRGTVTPDDMAMYLADRGLLPANATPRDLWAAIEQASKGRETNRKHMAAHNRNQREDERAAIKAGQAREQQVDDFESATQQGEGKEPVTSWDLYPGDTFDVEGEPFTVHGTVMDSDAGQVTLDLGNGETEVIAMDDADPGDIVLEDGARFGRQRLSTGEAIWVEKLNRKLSADEITIEPAPEEPLALEAQSPESVEKAQQTAAIRAEIARRAAAPLRGSLQTGDQTPDLFDATAGETPLLAQQTARQEPSEFESRLREKIRQEGLKGWTEADIRNATMFHMEHNNVTLPSKVKRSVVGRVELEMQTPAEQRAQRAEEAQALRKIVDQQKADLRRARETTDPIKNTDPALVEWADAVVEEGNVNFGLDPRLLAAHAVRAAYYLKRTAASFARWSQRMLSQFGEGIRAHLRRIYDTARTLLQDDGDLNIATAPAPILDDSAPDVTPLPEAIVATREASNPYSEGLWDAALDITLEQDNADPDAIQFAKDAASLSHIPEVVAGRPYGIDALGRTWIVTDQVHVTEADRNAAAGKTAARQALDRTIKEARESRMTAQQKAVRQQTQQALQDLESTGQWTGIVNDLWNLRRVELEGIVQDSTGDINRAQRAGMIPLTQSADAWNQMARDRAAAARIWISDNFGPQIERHLNNEQMPFIESFQEDALFREIQGIVDDTLAGMPPVRFSAASGPGILPRSVFYVGDVEIIRNPTDADYKQLSSSYRRDFPNDRSGDPTTRFTTDAEGNRWIWRSDNGTHFQIEPQISQAEGGKVVSQNEANWNARFSAKQTRPVVLAKGVSGADVQSAIRGLAKLLPNLKNTWVGTSAQLAAHLRGDQTFQRKWKDELKRRTRITEKAADEAWINFLSDGLTGVEALTFDGRTYLMIDQIDVTTERGGTGPLAARWVLNHEHTHEVTDHILARFPELREQWNALRNRVNPAQLDRLAERWTWLADWRNNPDLHDQIVHEWAAERIAEIETRGQPDPDSLIGKIVQWFKDVWRASMGVSNDINPSDRALLQFIEAARESYRQTLQSPSGSQIRFSAANPSGDANPDGFKNQVEGQWESPPPKPVYNLWSPAKRKIYDEYQKNADIPEDLRKFTEFLGNETDQRRIVQTLRPMQEYARATLGSEDGDYVPVTTENTETAYELARKMLSRKTFAKNYIRDFQINWSPRTRSGMPMHMGDAAVAVLQLELMDYAARLAAETGDAKLYFALLPYANDTIMGDYLTMSGAGRLLQVRSAATRQDGLYTALKTMQTGMEEAAAKDIGADAVEQLKTAIEPAKNSELTDDIAAQVESHLESEEGIAEAAAVEAEAEQYESDGFWERVLSMFQGQERADLHEFRQTLHKLDRLIQQQEFLKAQAASAARPSVSEDAGRWKNPEELAKAIEEEKSKLLELLGKLTKQETSSESKETRRKIMRGKGVQRAVKALNATAQAKAMIERFENRNKRVKREKPAWRNTFDEQVKNPVPLDDFIQKISGNEITEQTAARLFEIADELHQERKAQEAARATALANRKAATAATQAQNKAAAAATAAQKQAAAAAQKQATAAAAAIAKAAAAAQRKAAAAHAAAVSAAVRAASKTATAAHRQAAKAAAQIAKAAQDEADRLNRGTSPPTGTPRVRGARISYKALINFIAGEIAGAPLSQQADPAWVQATFTNAFITMGFPSHVAQRYATTIAGKYSAILKAAQEQAAMRAGKRLNMKEPKMKQIGEAIRTGVFDPMQPNAAVKQLALDAGYQPMTQADFQELAKLDQRINMGFPTLAAKAYTDVERILAKLRPKKSWQKIWAQLFTNGALSSLGVFSLNWLHPTYILARRLPTDIAALAGDAIMGKGNRAQHIALMGAMFTNLWEARKNFLNEARFSLKNDAYSNRMLEILNAENSLYEDLMRAVRDLQTGSPAQRTWAATKITWLSSDWVRRMLASADQTWGNVIQEFVLRNEAMRQMVQDAGMTVEQAALVIHQAAAQGAAAQARFTASGEDGPTAALIGRDVMRESLARGMSHLIATPKGQPTAGQSLLQTIQRESETELGNRASEDSRLWDVPNLLLESFKAAASAVRKRTELLGRPITGFVSVGANLLNRSLYFTPWGALRVLDKSFGDKAKREKIYDQTMQTDAQRRMRLYESIVGTVALLLLEVFRWKPEDKRWGIQVTGNGPKDKNLQDPWAKRGNKKGHIQLMDDKGNVMFSISYTRGGLDHLAVPLTFAGAHSDMDIEGLKPNQGGADYAWTYAQTAGGNMVKQAQFFGAKALFGSVPTSDKPHAIAGFIGYNANPFTPWGGLTRSIGKMITGPQDASSWNTAILSSMPIVQPFAGKPGPLLNALGDRIGAQPPEDWKVAADRAEFAGFPFYLALDPDSKDHDVYDFMMRAGTAPTVPLRTILESKNGFISDDTWTNYVKFRGSLLKDRIRAAIPRMNKMLPADVQSEMETISRDSTKDAKEKLGLQ